VLGRSNETNNSGILLSLKRQTQWFSNHPILTLFWQIHRCTGRTLALPLPDPATSAWHPADTPGWRPKGTRRLKSFTVACSLAQQCIARFGSDLARSSQALAFRSVFAIVASAEMTCDDSTTNSVTPSFVGK